MSVLNEIVSIKIKDVAFRSWDVSSVHVAPRPYHALVFRISGNAVFTHDNCTQSSGAGDIFYMPADYPYDAVYNEKNEIFVIHFESDLVGQMENYHLSNPHTLLLLFRKIYNIWGNKAEGFYYKSISVMCEILENISTQAHYTPHSEAYDSFEKAITYMNNNLTSAELTIEELADIAHMSNTYFRKLFLEKFGTTPVKYITSQRLIYAEKLLSGGKYTISEVAEKSGFCDAKYFSRIVKKEYGISPSKLYVHKV